MTASSGVWLEYSQFSQIKMVKEIVLPRHEHTASTCNEHTASTCNQLLAAVFLGVGEAHASIRRTISCLWELRARI